MLYCWYLPSSLPNVDTAMGMFDKAEMKKLIRNFMCHILDEKCGKCKIGLCPDNGNHLVWNTK